MSPDRLRAATGKSCWLDVIREPDWTLYAAHDEEEPGVQLVAVGNTEWVAVVGPDGPIDAARMPHIRLDTIIRTLDFIPEDLRTDDDWDTLESWAE